MNPSKPLPPKRLRTAPLYVLTAALASAAGAALTAVAHLGQPSILGVPVPNLAFWQDQDFPAREGWPVNKLPEIDRDPTDPNQPDLFLRQLRAQGHLQNSARSVATSSDTPLDPPSFSGLNRPIPPQQVRSYSTHRSSPERATPRRSRPLGTAPQRNNTRTTDTPAATSPATTPRRQAVRERRLPEAAPQPVQRPAESVIQKRPKRPQPVEPAAPAPRSAPPAAPAPPPAAPAEQTNS